MVTSKAAEAEFDHIRQRHLRDTLGSYPTGVTIMTTRDEAGEPVGMTANSFASVSLDPPLILWSVSRVAYGFAAYSAAFYFGVNILAEGQDHISNRFARTGEDKFAGIRKTEGIGGVPLISGAAAQLECRTWKRYDGGDHLILLGEVKEFRHWDRTPLVFASGRYAKLASSSGKIPDADWPISFW